MRFGWLPRKKTIVVSVLFDAWNMPHPEDCTCYKCSGNPESFGFMLINKDCLLCKNEKRIYCEKECPIKLKAIENYKVLL
jgi:hypothetical protein